MDQIYEFADWTSASRMKNSERPELKIDVAVLSKDKEVIGYHLSVYNKIDQKVYYAFDIDREEGWSLSTEQAIGALNRLGFPCMIRKDFYQISDKVKKILENLLELGYTHINKIPEGSHITVSRDEKKWSAIELKRIVKDYNYHDYAFLHDCDPAPIKGILKDVENGVY